MALYWYLSIMFVCLFTYVVYPGTRDILLGTYLLHISVQYPPKRRDIGRPFEVVLQGCDTENLIVTFFETTTLFFAC